jgi:hypothetical protein
MMAWTVLKHNFEVCDIGVWRFAYTWEGRVAMGKELARFAQESAWSNDIIMTDNNSNIYIDAACFICKIMIGVPFTCRVKSVVGEQNTQS